MLPCLHYICIVTLLTAMLLLAIYLHHAGSQPAEGGVGERLKTFSAAANQMSGHGENRASYLAETSDLIVVGKIIRVRTAHQGRPDALDQEVDQESDGRLVLTVTIEDVLKDTHHAGGVSMLNVVAIQRPSDVRTVRSFGSHPGEATEEEKLKQSFEELTMDDQFVLFLNVLDGSQGAEAREPENEVYSGYRYMNAIKVEPRAVELVKEYIHLAEIPDPELREQAIVKFAFSLLRDHTPLSNLPQTR